MAHARRVASLGLSSILLVVMTCPVFGQEAGADQAKALLKQGITQYDAFSFVEAQKCFLKAAAILTQKSDALSKGDTASLDDYLRKVNTAVQAQRSVRDGLRSADEAMKTGKFAEAEAAYSAASDSQYLPEAERKDARAKLALAKEKAKVAAASAPAAATPVPAVTPVPAAPETPVPAAAAVAPVAEPVVVAATAAPAAPTALAAEPVAAPVPSAAPAGNAMDKLSAQSDAKAKELLDAGKKALAANNFAQAADYLSRAAAYDPNNIEIQKNLKFARDHMTAPANEDSVLSKAERDRQIAKQMAEVDIDKLTKQATDLLNAINKSSDFDEAAALVNRAKQTLQINQRFFSPEDYRSRLASMDIFLKNLAGQKQVWTDNEKTTMQAEASKAESQRQAQEATEKARKIKVLKEKARTLLREQRYAESLEAVQQILAIDSQDAWAGEQQDTLQQFVILQKRKAVDRDQNIQEQELMVDLNESMVPWHEELQFPRNWDVIRKRAERLAGLTPGESEANRAVWLKLRQVISSLDFEEIAFKDVIDFLRTMSGCNIVVNWKAMQLVGLDKTTLVTVHLQKVTVERALNVILQDVGGTNPLQFIVNDGIVTISTKDDLAKYPFARTYDIRHLLFRVPNFVGPRMDFNAATNSSGNNQSSSSIWNTSTDNNQSSEDNVPTRQQMVNDLIETVKATIDPASWTGGEASLRETHGMLIVTQTARNHQEIANLLNMLRETRAMQVSIEARFISVSTGFLNVIGMDFDVYFNLGSTLNTGTTVTDPFTGAVVPTNTGSTWGGGSGNNKFTPMGATTGSGARTVGYGGRLSDYSGTGVASPIANSLTDPAFSISGIFLDDIQVDFLLEATQANQSTRTITAPRITVWNGQRAYVTVSTQQAYISGYEATASTGDGGDAVTTPIVDYVPSGATLDVEATVTDDRKYVILTVRPQVSNATSITSVDTPAGPIGLPVVSVQQLETTVMVPDGGTLLLGGTTIAGEVERELGVPLLSKIPVLNRLTTNRGKARDQEVLLILIRPKIIIHDEEEARQKPE